MAFAYAAALGVEATIAGLVLRRRGLPLRSNTVATALAFSALGAYTLADGPATLVVACLAAGLVVSAATDVGYGLILDATTACTCGVLLVLAACSGAFPAALLGCASAGSASLLLHMATRGRGFGLGDVKLAGTIGAGVGCASAFATLGAAFVLGAVVSLVALALGRARFGQRLAFAPYLAAGAFGVLVWERMHA